jgi:SAM-dependent methyltransferase
MSARKPAADNLVLLDRLATLSDLPRLRVLRLLAREELSVGELARAMQLPQSTVSRHLKLLHEGGWLVKRSEGTASLYKLDEASLDPAARELWTLTRDQLDRSITLDEDDHRLAEVLAQRRTDSRAFFGRIGGEWDRLRRELFGEWFTHEALLSLLPSNWTVADLGCGTGNIAEILAPVVGRIIAVDREPAMLDAARKRLELFDTIDFRQGDLTALPLKDREVDAALLFLVLHHVPDPERALAEMSRVLRPGGNAMIVDMTAHDREAYRHTMGHQHLGFDRRAIERWAKAAGFGDLRYRRLRPDTEGKGPGLFVATMRKP